jgi:tetratricopeptide (TPR) repeat protein
VYRAQGRPAEAEAALRAAVAENPGFGPGWQALGELYLAAGRWAEVEEAAARLGGGAPVEAALLRARAQLARRDFAAARALLEGATAAAPRVLALRVLLSRVLLQEGRDRAAAERALREVLALDPANPEARNNLAVLAGQAGLPPGAEGKSL